MISDGSITNWHHPQHDTVADGTLWVLCVGETNCSCGQRSRVDAEGQRGGLCHLSFVCPSRHPLSPRPHIPFTLPSDPGGWSVWSTSCVFSILAEPNRRSERQRGKVRVWSGYLFPLLELAVSLNQRPCVLTTALRHSCPPPTFSLMMAMPGCS